MNLASAARRATRALPPRAAVALAAAFYLLTDALGPDIAGPGGMAVHPLSARRRDPGGDV